jgi:hypothetical protein
VKHSFGIYATQSFRIYVLLLTVAALVSAPAHASTTLRPWRAHIREAAAYAASRAGTVTFGVASQWQS